MAQMNKCRFREVDSGKYFNSTWIELEGRLVLGKRKQEELRLEDHRYLLHVLWWASFWEVINIFSEGNYIVSEEIYLRWLLKNHMEILSRHLTITAISMYVIKTWSRWNRRKIIEKEQGLGPCFVMCQHLAVGQSRRGPRRRLERMVNEVGHWRNMVPEKARKCLLKMRVVSSLEWCWEVEQSEDGMVTCRFDHIEDVEDFDKCFDQDRGHIGVVGGEPGKWGSEDSECTQLSPVMELEK